MIRRAWTTAELRALSKKIRPPYDQMLIDEAKAALLYAADDMDAARAVIAERKKEGA